MAKYYLQGSIIGYTSPVSRIIARYLVNIDGNGGEISSEETDSITTLLNILEDNGILSKVKELYVPAGDALAGQVRLICKGNNYIVGNTFTPEQGTYGLITSSCRTLTDIDYTNFSFGAYVTPGFYAGSFDILFGSNGTNYNTFCYDWNRGVYDKVVGNQMCFGPSLTPSDKNGEALLYNPSWAGFLSVSAGEDEHFLTRDGEIIAYFPQRMFHDSMTDDAIYLPFAGNLYCHASYVSSYLTKAESKILETAIRNCVDTFNRTNTTVKKVNRVIMMGDSRTYSTQQNALPYANTVYKQVADLMNWTPDETDFWAFGMSGRKVSQWKPDGTDINPTYYSVESIIASRPTGDFNGRLVIYWNEANDLLIGATANDTKVDLDETLVALKAAGAIVVVVGAPPSYGAGHAGDVNDEVTAWNALLENDDELTNGVKAYGYVKINDIIDPDDTDDSFDGVHLTDTAYGKVATRIVATLASIGIDPIP